MNSIAVLSRRLLGKRSGEPRRGGIARLVDRLTRSATVWPAVADRASYAAQRETTTSPECHELELLFQSSVHFR
jgi:hypothetical protein